MKPSCAECRFFAESKGLTYHGAPVGECRYHAPSVGQFTTSPAAWPMVAPTKWCGKFQPKDEGGK